MCGRYELKWSACDEKLQNLLKGLVSEGMWKEGQICPGSLAPAVFMNKSTLKASLMYWGFEGPQGLVINARAESAAEKPMFRGCVKAFRCLLPATGYFEWHQKTGARYRMDVEAENQFYLAGLYLPQPDGPARCVVLTREADTAVKEIHPRMPLILASAQERAVWLEDAQKAEMLLLEAGVPALSARAEEPEQMDMFDLL